MKAVVVGCGRVGSAVALQLAAEGWDVTAIDEDEEALGRLGKGWKGGFVVGHAMETEVLLRAGIEEADAAVVATSGDNTNLVLGQVIQKRYEIGCVVVRVLDPRRAEFFARLGLRTISPTQTAISTLVEAVRACEVKIPLPEVEVEA
jgi:trk system potassium uptake protein